MFTLPMLKPALNGKWQQASMDERTDFSATLFWVLILLLVGPNATVQWNFQIFKFHVQINEWKSFVANRGFHSTKCPSLASSEWTFAYIYIYAPNMDNEHKETNRHHPSLCSLPSDYCLALVLRRIHDESTWKSGNIKHKSCDPHSGILS